MSKHRFEILKKSSFQHSNTRHCKCEPLQVLEVEYPPWRHFIPLRITICPLSLTCSVVGCNICRISYHMILLSSNGKPRSLMYLCLCTNRSRTQGYSFARCLLTCARRNSNHLSQPPPSDAKPVLRYSQIHSP